MKIKIISSTVFALLLCAFLAYNSESVKANSNDATKLAPFAGFLHSLSGCPTQTGLLDGIPYLAENRTTGDIETGVTSFGGKWNVQSAHTGDLIKVTFTSKGKIGCILQEQSSTGYTNLNVCMTNYNACPNEW